MGLHLPKTKGMLRREAANWLARLQSGADPDINHKFQHWQDADPRRAAAFDRVSRSYQQAGLLRHSTAAASRPPESARSKNEWKAAPALAAAAALAVLIPTAVVLFRDANPMLGGTQVMMLMTRVGEIRQVELADGSKITLDGASKVDVEIGRSGRSAHLRYGRARFQIARTDAAFVVKTATSTTTARQGVIDVEQTGEQGRIGVLAGTADVSGSGGGRSSRAVLGAGESVMVSSGGAQQKGILAPAFDWTRGMLKFDGTPLAAAVALANRYSQQHIILVGDPGTLRVTGAFRAGDTAGLAKALAAAFRLSLHQRADGNLVLSRKGPPAAQK